MNCNLTCRAISIVLLVLSGLQWQTPGVFAQAPFYQGKTITVLQGREPGGTGDLRARAVTQFLQKYIPGNPTIIHEFMAGGGVLRAANHMYAVAKPDGLTIGSVSSGICSAAQSWAAPASNINSKNFITWAPPTPAAIMFSTPAKRPVRII